MSAGLGTLTPLPKPVGGSEPPDARAVAQIRRLLVASARRGAVRSRMSSKNRLDWPSGQHRIRTCDLYGVKAQ